MIPPLSKRLKRTPPDVTPVPLQLERLWEAGEKYGEIKMWELGMLHMVDVFLPSLKNLVRHLISTDVERRVQNGFHLEQQWMNGFGMGLVAGQFPCWIFWIIG